MLKMKSGNLIEFSFPQNKTLAIFVSGILGFILPAVYGFIVGFPIPRVQDEFAYLLGAETFAAGRLTNLTPICWQSFESPHLLLIPSYMSKYPPMQSLFLAAGEVLFGHPIFGVWLSCGLAAAAVCWMMQAWTTAKWAFGGTLMMITFIGINSYWAQSYWGGMIAVFGGALLFGGFRRLYRKIAAFDTAIMTLGGAILINTRPFEGSVTIIFILIVLSIRLLKNNKESLLNKFSKVILPGALITAAFLGMMGYYNFKVTGNAFKLPYAIHQQQYFAAPLFIFQQPNTNPLSGHYRLQELSDYYTEPRFTKTFFEMSGLPDKVYLRPFYFFISLLIFMPNFFVYAAFTIFLFVTLPFLLKKKKSLILILAAILFTFAVMSIATFWDQYHYSAHLTGCFYLLTIESVRYFILLCKKQKNLFYRRIAYSGVLILVLISFIRLNISEDDTIRFYGKEPDKQINYGDTFIKLAKPRKAFFLREQIERNLSQTQEKYLLIVSYAKGYSFDDEIVYNHADLDNSPVVWAHDLGTEKNKALSDYYNDRKLLLIKISSSHLTIEPKSSNQLAD